MRFAELTSTAGSNFKPGVVVKSAYSELKIVRSAWQTTSKAKPNELDFSVFGYAEISATDFDGLFDQWDVALAGTLDATSSASTANEKVMDLVAVRAFRDIRAQVEAAQGNGFSWLLNSSPFLQKISEAQAALMPVIEKRVFVRKELIKLSKSNLNGAITAVENAAPLAQEIAKTHADMTLKAGAFNELVTDSNGVKEKVDADAAAVEAQLKTIRDLASQAGTSKQGFDETVTQSTTLLEEVQLLLGQAQETRETVDKAILHTHIQTEATDKRLAKALADINRQALAESFSHRAKMLGRERLGWLVTFGVSIAWIVFVGYEFANPSAKTLLNEVVSNGANLASVPMWSGLLKALPFELPAIWLGWLAAKNAGMTGRVQQDYNYKVATAYAFQGYKKEVEGEVDKELLGKLKGIAIRNFGENPIRIYEGKDEHGHPLEALRAMFADEKIYKKFLELAKAAGTLGKGAD